MAALLLVHLVVAAVCGLTGRALGRRVFLVALVAPLATVAWVVAHRSVLDSDAYLEGYEWIPQLGLDISFRVDGFSLMMLGVIGLIGVAVMAFAAQYFSTEAGLGWFAALLVLFAASMTGLVAADAFLLLFVFWELTSITSYGLIGFADTKRSARHAARQALLMTGGGGLVLLAGLVLLSQVTGADSFSALAQLAPAGVVTGTGAEVAALLILIGCFSKSAQVPLHGWLPGAMAAPAPVSAFLHSATMVKAGVFLIARLTPTMQETNLWQPLAIGVGLSTMVWGAWRALRQQDIKMLLAYGTVSQLGMLVAAFGAGTPKLIFAGTAMLLAHAIYKAALFMLVGVVDHTTHTRRIDELRGLGRSMPIVSAIAAVCTLSMAGFPPLMGFVAKEVAIVGFIDAPFAGANAVTWWFVGASALSVAYAWRFWWGAFGTFGADTKPTIVHRPSAIFVAPAGLLAVVTLALGLAASQFDAIVSPAASALDAASDAYRLVLWPGFGTPLLLSALALGFGTLLFVVRDPVERLQNRVGFSHDSDQYFIATLRAVLRGASAITGVVQPGSLPVYLGVILVAAMLPAGVLFANELDNTDSFTFATTPVQVVAASVAALAALALAVTLRRFVAVILLGAVGTSVAVLFVDHGAPDLALTQVLVDIVTIAVFALVLRHLPQRLSPSRLRRAQVVRVLISATVGVTVLVATLASTGARTNVPIDDELLSRAYPDGEGKNVVNVTLVDFRGFDTLGEIFVLAVAAIGVAMLVIVNRRPNSDVPLDVEEVV